MEKSATSQENTIRDELKVICSSFKNKKHSNSVILQLFQF